MSVEQGASGREDPQWRANRYSMRRPVSYRHVGEVGWRHAMTLDISQSGIMLFGTALPRVGEQIELRLGLTAEGLPHACEVKAKAVVVREVESTQTIDGAVAARFLDYKLLPYN
jgi:hypothetical protein